MSLCHFIAHFPLFAPTTPYLPPPTPSQDAWEALCCYDLVHAAPTTAVVAAQSFWDYAQRTDAAVPGVGEAYKATGRCFSVAAGRISFCFGLRGENPCSQYLSSDSYLLVASFNPDGIEKKHVSLKCLLLCWTNLPVWAADQISKSTLHFPSSNLCLSPAVLQVPRSPSIPPVAAA
jgi:hypothetical protein